MKCLVVYYSRTGITRTVAKSLIEALGADEEELVDTKGRQGRLGFLAACLDAARRKLVPIEPVKKNPAAYDLVVIGTPVWASTMSSAVRAYLAEHGKSIRAAALFCTTHTSGIEQTNRDMQSFLTAKAGATAGFLEKSVKRGEHIAAVDAFLGKCKAGVSPSQQA